MSGRAARGDEATPRDGDRHRGVGLLGEVTTGGLVEELDISRQTLSEWLQQGYRRPIEGWLTVSPPGEDGQMSVLPRSSPARTTVASVLCGERFRFSVRS